MNPRRRLALNLRRALRKVHRRFDVVNLGDGRVRLTCRKCGTVTIERPGERSGSVLGPEMERKLASYWATPNGISGNCDTCLRAERDRRYPLPREAP